MRTHPITSALKRLMPPGKEVIVLWNGDIERWQVYELSGHGFIRLNGQQHKNFRILWTIQHKNGDYRDPDTSDIKRMQDSVEASMLVWANASKVADDLDDINVKQEREISPAAAGKIREVAEIMGFMRKKGFLVK